MAEIAAAVRILDSDLAGRLRTHDDAAAMLTEPQSHGRVRISTDALRQRLPVPDGAYLAALDREPTRGMILRSPADLPAGMRRLATVLTDIGAELNAVDAHAAVRVLAAAALPGLRRALAEPLTTVSAPDLRLWLLTGELYRHIGRWLTRTPPAVVAGWAAQTPAVAAALSTACGRSRHERRLLTCRDKDGAIAAAGWRLCAPPTAQPTSPPRRCAKSVTSWPPLPRQSLRWQRQLALC